MIRPLPAGRPAPGPGVPDLMDAQAEGTITASPADPQSMPMEVDDRHHRHVHGSRSVVQIVGVMPVIRPS